MHGIDDGVALKAQWTGKCRFGAGFFDECRSTPVWW